MWMTGAIVTARWPCGPGRRGRDPSDPAQVEPLLEGLDIRMDYGGDGVQRCTCPAGM